VEVFQIRYVAALAVNLPTKPPATIRPERRLWMFRGSIFRMSSDFNSLTKMASNTTPQI
jgi:hypothetical protein